jgi:hypothetical protein
LIFFKVMSMSYKYNSRNLIIERAKKEEDIKAKS